METHEKNYENAQILQSILQTPTEEICPLPAVSDRMSERGDTNEKRSLPESVFPTWFGGTISGGRWTREFAEYIEFSFDRNILKNRT